MSLTTRGMSTATLRLSKPQDLDFVGDAARAGAQPCELDQRALNCARLTGSRQWRPVAEDPPASELAFRALRYMPRHFRP